MATSCREADNRSSKSGYSQSRRLSISSIETQKLVKKQEPRGSYGTLEVDKQSVKRMWFKTPFGKLMYAHNASQYDSYMDNKTNTQNDLGNLTNNTQQRLINYLEGNIDFPWDQANDPVSLYIRHRRIFIVWLSLLLILNIVCSFVGLKQRKQEINTISARENSRNSSKILDIFLDIFLTVDMIVYLSVAGTGLVSYITNKSRYFNAHSYLCVGEIIVVVFLSYIHQIFLGAFLVRIIYYVYVRFVISLLHTILLIPQNEPQEQT